MKITIPYKPRYPEVHKALMSTRFCVLVAHRRFGKTVLAVNHLIRQAIACAKVMGHFGYVAPYRNQAKSVAWDYLKRYTRVIPGVRVNESELAVELPSAAGGAKIRIFGADKPDALRGLYFDGIVLDEVAQMKPEVWEEIIQPALADRQGFALFIGTPKGINLFSTLYFQAVREQGKGSGDWLAMSFPCDKTDALPEKEIARLREELSDNKFRQEMMCDFTASSEDTLISLDEVTAALERLPNMEIADNYPLVLGVDIARFGEDATVFFPRRGLAAYEPVILNKHSNTDVAHRLLAFIGEHKPAFVNIDQGQGTGVIDMVRDLATGRTVVTEVPFGSRAIKDRKYVNRRAEMWDSIRLWLKEGGCLPGHLDKLLKSELTAPRYDFDAAGKIRLEAKDEIRKRLGHSTDIGDALALTFAIPVSPDKSFNPARKNRRQDMYDPFA